MNVRVFLSRQEIGLGFGTIRAHYCRVLFDSFCVTKRSYNIQVWSASKCKERPSTYIEVKQKYTKVLTVCMLRSKKKTKICVHFYFRFRTILNVVRDQILYHLICFNFRLAFALKLWFNQSDEIYFLSDQNEH